MTVQLVWEVRLFKTIKKSEVGDFCWRREEGKAGANWIAMEVNDFVR